MLLVSGFMTFSFTFVQMPFGFAHFKPGFLRPEGQTEGW